MNGNLVSAEADQVVGGDPIEPALLAGRKGADRGQKHGASAGITSTLEKENGLDIA